MRYLACKQKSLVKRWQDTKWICAGAYEPRPCFLQKERRPHLGPFLEASEGQICAAIRVSLHNRQALRITREE